MLCTHMRHSGAQSNLTDTGICAIGIACSAAATAFSIQMIQIHSPPKKKSMVPPDGVTLRFLIHCSCGVLPLYLLYLYFILFFKTATTIT